MVNQLQLIKHPCTPSQSDRATDRWLNFLLQDSDDDDEPHTGVRRSCLSSYEESIEEDDEIDGDDDVAGQRSGTYRWGSDPHRDRNSDSKQTEAEAEAEAVGADVVDPLDTDSSIIIIRANHNIRNINNSGNGNGNLQYVQFADNML